MLGKKYSLGSTFESTGEQRIKLANFDELKSQGADIASFLESFKPNPGFTYLHVIAMGAGEYYGCNVNGDYFPEKDLIARHHTFVEQAKVFKEHDNKPTSPSFGNVVFSWYNPKMHRVELILALDKIKGEEFIRRQDAGEQLEVSMGCFPAGTLITMADGSQKPIETVAPGERVRTHRGRPRKVVTAMTHYYTDKVYTFNISGQSETLTATKEHPILIRRYSDFIESGEGQCPVCGKHVRQVYTHVLRKQDNLHKVYLAEQNEKKYDYIEQWVEASEVKLGDYVVTPIYKQDSQFKSIGSRDISLARLLGYFLAEGSYVKNAKGKYRAIQFNFADTEVEYHQEVLSCLADMSAKKPTYQIRESKHVACISLYDKDLAELFYNYIGEYSHSKHLSTEIFNWPQELQLAFLGAYMDGDGSWNKIHKALCSSTISKTLRYDIEQLAALCGIKTTTYNYKGKHHQIYVTKIARDGLHKLNRYSTKIANDKCTWTSAFLAQTFIHKDAIVRKIVGIKITETKNLPVYNLSVEEDESFVAENVAVHNCRVRFDVCSICGNKATAKNPYCEHIKYHKREVYPDGKQAYMINVNPTFFDISIVRRRADKIAYVLNKVASINSAASLMGKNAELFEHLSSELETSLIPLAPTPDEAIFAIPDNDDMQKIAATLNDREEQEKLAMVKRIKAQAVRVLQKGIEEALPALERVEPDLPVALLDRMARRHSIEDILHSFFLNAIPMKPKEFTRIIIVQNGIPLEQFNNVLAGVRAARPANQISQGHYQKEIGSLLEKFLIDRSSFLPAVMHRMDKVKTSAALNMNVPMAYYDLNPNLNFGHVRRPAPYTEINQSIDAIPVYRNSYAQTPVMMSPVQVEEQKLRPKLKEPHMGPVKTGLTLGALYAAYKTHGALDTILKDPKNMALVALLAGLVAQKLDSRKPGGQENGRVKTAGFVKSFGGKIALPFVGVHLLAGHYRNQYNHGKDLNFAERYVAENPDMLSLIAPVAINYALKKHAAIELPDDIDYDIPEEDVEKIAEFSDKVSDFANAAVPGIILRGRRHSILSSIVDQAIDQKIINQFTSS